MVTHCLNCQTELSDKRGGAKFCTQECKNKYSYRLRSGQLSDFKKEDPKQEKTEKENQLLSSLRGVIENDQEPEATDANKSKSNGIDALFFNNLINQDVLNDGDKLEQNGQAEPEEPLNPYLESEEPPTEPVRNLLPEKYVTKEIQTPNPDYSARKSKLDFYKEDKAKVEQEYKKLEAELKYQQTRDGSGIVLSAGLGGGILGVMDTLNNDPSQNGQKKYTTGKTGKSSIWESLFKIALYGTIGTGAGYLVKNLTEESREKEKKEKIAWLLKRMAELRLRYSLILGAINFAQTVLSQVPQYKLETKQVLNPDYEKAINGNALEGIKMNIEQGQTKTSKKGFKQTEPITFKSNKIIKATDLGKREFKALNFDGLWRAFVGLPSVNFHALIHGNSGEGKSTFCLWFARYLAENFGRVLYVSGEEGVNKTFHDKLIYCEAEVANFYILDVRTGEEFMEEVGENEFHFIILDSLHDMDIDARKLKEIFERYKNTGFICIDQNNKKGELLGANEKKHIVDLVVNVKNYTAETTKNRFKEKGLSFKTADFAKNLKPKNDSSKLPKKGNGNTDGYNLDNDRRGLV